MSNKKDRPKFINEYSVDELLELLSSGGNVDPDEITELSEEEQIDNSVVKFLIYYDIKPGNYSISIKALYKLFNSWNKEKKMDITYFLKTINIFFNKKNLNYNYYHNSYIKINTSMAKITKHIEDIKRKKINTRLNKYHLKYMDEFLTLNNIKAGPVYVEADILYYLFDYYNFKKKRKHISYQKFVSMCFLYFSFRQLGFGSMWFGVTENIKDLITPEWVKVWRQGRVNYGYITKKKSKEKKTKLYTTSYSTEEVQKRKILYAETLPEEKSSEQNQVSSSESSVQSEK